MHACNSHGSGTAAFQCQGKGFIQQLLLKKTAQCAAKLPPINLLPAVLRAYDMDALPNACSAQHWLAGPLASVKACMMHWDSMGEVCGKTQASAHPACPTCAQRCKGRPRELCLAGRHVDQVRPQRRGAVGVRALQAEVHAPAQHVHTCTCVCFLLWALFHVLDCHSLLICRSNMERITPQA